MKNKKQTYKEYIEQRAYMEFVEKLKIAHNKLNNVIIERDLSHYLINLIEEYEEKSKNK